jgi:hypothetical protein
MGRKMPLQRNSTKFATVAKQETDEPWNVTFDVPESDYQAHNKPAIWQQIGYWFFIVMLMVVLGTTGFLVTINYSDWIAGK